MFLDISRFSSWPSGTTDQQESILRVLSLFFSEMIKIVEDYGGVVEKNTGDGLMAYFVGTKSSGASQQLAVECALTMFYAGEHLINAVLDHSRIPRIEFRICIDHGPITVAKVGVARGFNGIVAIGSTANIASKMLAVADAGELLIGNDVLSGLPSDWVRDWVQFKKSDTGWFYRATDNPYIFWRYAGRWSGPK